MQEGLRDVGVTVLGENVYVLGGERGGTARKEGWRLEGQEWRRIRDMREPTLNCTVVKSEERKEIYVIGGIGENGDLKCIQRYRAEKD